MHFWDRRTQQQLESFDDMHMDDVTQVSATADSTVYDVNALNLCMVMLDK